MVQNVNLYDPSLRIQRDWLSAESFGLSVLGAVLAVALGAGFMRWQLRQIEEPARQTAAALQAQQDAIQELARRVDSLRPDPRLIADVSNTQSTLQQRQEALRMLRAGGLGHEQGHAQTMEAFARQHVEGLWLTGLTLERADMALRGRAMRPELIPTYVGRLNQEPALQGRSFRALDIVRPMEEASATPAATVNANTNAGDKPAGPTAPRHAAFVEFSLTGSAGTVTTAGQEDKR